MTRNMLCLILLAAVTNNIVLSSMVFPNQVNPTETEKQPAENNEFYFGSNARHPAARNQGSTVTPSTQKPSTTTQREFTGIAFPPQVFEILTGGEPTTQNLGGRKNVTSSSAAVVSMSNNANDTTNTLNLTTVPEIINGATRPPTRFPPGNKPPYIRPPQRPSQPAPSPNRPLEQGINSGNLSPTFPESPDNRVGAATTPVPAATQRPRWTTTTQRPQRPKTPDFREAKNSIRSVQQYLQNALLSGSGATWDASRSNFLVSPLSVGLTMAQMMMAGGPRAKSFLRGALQLYVKSDPHEEVRHELNYHKQLGALVQSIQKQAVPLVDSTVWSRASEQPYTLDSHTAIFVQTGLLVRSTFIHGIEDIYHGRLALVDFNKDPSGTVNSINQWAETVTRGKIKNFLSGPPSSNTAALFASSLYFKAPWREAFNMELTGPGDFRVTPREVISTEYMTGDICDGAKYIDSTKYGVKAVALAYNNTNDISLYIILPKNANTSIQELAKKLIKPSSNNAGLSQRMNSNSFIPLKNFQDPLPPSWEAHKQATASVPHLVTRLDLPEDNTSWEIDDMISSMKAKRVTVTIPKMTLRGSLRLNPPGNGGKDQLAGLLEDPNKAIGATSSETIIHETVLELSETGTEAAAITAGSIDYIGGAAVLKADRPFLILLRHETTGLPLFWGAVVRPNMESTRHVLNYN